MKKLLLALLLLLGSFSPVQAQFMTVSQMVTFGCQYNSNATLFMRTTADVIAACHTTDVFGGATTSRFMLPYDGTISNFRCYSDGVIVPGAGSTIVFTPRFNVVDSTPTLTLSNSTVGGEGNTVAIDHANTKWTVSGGTALSVKLVTTSTTGTNRATCNFIYTFNVPANQ